MTFVGAANSADMALPRDVVHLDICFRPHQLLLACRVFSPTVRIPAHPTPCTEKEYPGALRQSKSVFTTQKPGCLQTAHNAMYFSFCTNPAGAVFIFDVVCELHIAWKDGSDLLLSAGTESWYAAQNVSHDDDQLHER